MSVRCVSAEWVCGGSGRKCSDNVQEMLRQRPGSAQTTFTKQTDNVRLRAGGLTAIERLRGEMIGGYKQTAGGYMQTLRKCADSGKQGGRDGQAENVQLRDDGD